MFRLYISNTLIQSNVEIYSLAFALLNYLVSLTFNRDTRAQCLGYWCDDCCLGSLLEIQMKGYTLLSLCCVYELTFLTKRFLRGSVSMEALHGEFRMECTN